MSQPPPPPPPPLSYGHIQRVEVVPSSGGLELLLLESSPAKTGPRTPETALPLDDDEDEYQCNMKGLEGLDEEEGWKKRSEFVVPSPRSAQGSSRKRGARGGDVVGMDTLVALEDLIGAGYVNAQDHVECLGLEGTVLKDGWLETKHEKYTLDCFVMEAVKKAKELTPAIRQDLNKVGAAAYKKILFIDKHKTLWDLSEQWKRDILRPVAGFSKQARSDPDLFDKDDQDEAKKESDQVSLSLGIVMEHASPTQMPLADEEHQEDSLLAELEEDNKMSASKDVSQRRGRRDEDPYGVDDGGDPDDDEEDDEDYRAAVAAANIGLKRGSPVKKKVSPLPSASSQKVLPRAPFLEEKTTEKKRARTQPPRTNIGTVIVIDSSDEHMVTTTPLTRKDATATKQRPAKVAKIVEDSLQPEMEAAQANVKEHRRILASIGAANAAATAATPISNNNNNMMTPSSARSELILTSITSSGGQVPRAGFVVTTSGLKSKLLFFSLFCVFCL